jgi:glucosamine-6-phosphate deaminase
VNCQAFPSEAALAAALGRRVADAISRQPSLVLGLPTGRTPLALYAELVRLTRAETLDWSGVRTFNLDEFVRLGRGDAGSYRTFMEDRLFSKVRINPKHIGFLDGRAANLAAECARYERAIADAGGLDLLILGIGANGHVGFNEPAEALAARTHVVELDEPTRAANALWFGGDIRAVPREALTMGMATILAARAIVLIATGEAKSEAVTAMLEGRVTTRVPASFLQLHPHVTVMLDEPLAEGLPSCNEQMEQE